MEIPQSMEDGWVRPNGQVAEEIPQSMEFQWCGWFSGRVRMQIPQSMGCLVLLSGLEPAWAGPGNPPVGELPVMSNRSQVREEIPQSMDLSHSGPVTKLALQIPQSVAPDRSKSKNHST